MLKTRYFGLFESNDKKEWDTNVQVYGQCQNPLFRSSGSLVSFIWDQIDPKRFGLILDIELNVTLSRKNLYHDIA